MTEEDQYFFKFLSEFINVSPQGAKTGSCRENEHLKLEIIAKYAEHGQVSVMKVSTVSVYLSCILKKATMKFTTTARGNRKLIKDGYMYVFKKHLANDNSTWGCELRRNGESLAYIKLDVFEDFIELRNEDSRPQSQTKCNITKTKVNLKRRATEKMDTSRHIVCRIGKCI